MKHELQMRLTRKYVGTYQHLDQWETIGEYEIVSSGTLEQKTDIDCAEDPQTTVRIVTVERDPRIGANDSQVQKALEASHSSSGCAHEYDCCGCRNYYATALKMPYHDDQWTVVINSSRNY